MAVGIDVDAIREFDQWYESRHVDDHDNTYRTFQLSPLAWSVTERHKDFKREMDARTANYHKLEMAAAGEVVTKKKDLPNISSGETAGLIRRIARNVVQNVPNVQLFSAHDPHSVAGVFADFVLRDKVIGDDYYSNNMQQHLYGAALTSLTVGFECAIPVLMEDPSRGWVIQYDSIKYSDVYPEPGVKDVREAQEVFVRRWLSRGELKALVRNTPAGWDETALRTLLQSDPPRRDHRSSAHQDRKHRTIPQGYELVTWYSSSGDPFLTFDARTKMLLRIEENRHPQKKHPVFFLVMEIDPQQPLGVSQVELLLGRQEFQDLMLNGAMKLWYRNINPSIIAYGAPNAVPNISPGKYTQISNPNARIETFEVNTQTLMQYGSISQQNLGSMVNLVGAADQQMAAHAGNGFSATPAGVEAQQAMVDITTNNYQKAVEAFFSSYCSYALTLYFHELRSVSRVTPTAKVRQSLVDKGMPAEVFNEDGSIDIKFSDLATDYWVTCVPGSLVELEDEKQLRILNSLFVPLSQAMPAFAAAEDQEMLRNASRTMQLIMRKTLEVSGAENASELSTVLVEGMTPELEAAAARTDALEESVSGLGEGIAETLGASETTLTQMQEQISIMSETLGLLLEKMGVLNQESGVNPGVPGTETPQDT